MNDLDLIRGEMVAFRRLAAARGRYLPTLAGPLAGPVADWLAAPVSACPHIAADADQGRMGHMFAHLGAPGVRLCLACYSTAWNTTAADDPQALTACHGCGSQVPAPFEDHDITVPLAPFVTGIGRGCPECRSSCPPFIPGQHTPPFDYEALAAVAALVHDVEDAVPWPPGLAADLAAWEDPDDPAPIMMCAHAHTGATQPLYGFARHPRTVLCADCFAQAQDASPADWAGRCESCGQPGAHRIRIAAGDLTLAAQLCPDCATTPHPQTGDTPA